MAEEHSDYHDVNSFTLKDLDQSTSTNTLAIQHNTKRPLKPVVQSYLKVFIKITRQETKAAHHLDIQQTKKDFVHLDLMETFRRKLSTNTKLYIP